MTPLRRPFVSRFRALFLVAAASLAALPSAAQAARPDLPPAIVADRNALQATLRDADAEELPGGFVVVVPKAFAAPTPLTDPRFGWRFSRIVTVYAARRDGRPGLARRFVVHFEPDERDKAIQAARLYARLLRLHKALTGREATFRRDADSADVWLCEERPERTPNFGGETRDKDVYIYAVGSDRTSVEWTRTLVHEWGHLTLYAARGFTDPEADAAGYLGERLYMKWLREDAIAQSTGSDDITDDGATRADLDLYYKRQIAPLIARFHEAGPQSKTLAGAGQDAMDLYIGAVLASDEAFGAKLTGDALYSIEGVRPRDFLDSLERVIARAPTATVRLPAWIPLSRARYAITATNGDGTIAIADRPPLTVGATKPASLRVIEPGWKWTRATSGGVSSLTLRRP